MALVTCPDCSSEISTLAPTCPRCGRPRDSPAPSGRRPPRFLRRLGLLAALVTVAVALYEVRHARALGVPTLTTLAYTGSLLTFGSPDNSTHSMQLELFVAGANDGGSGSAACVTTLSVTCVNGQFTIPLSPSCVAVVQQNANIETQVTIDNNAMGLVNVSAVPYAIVAGTASQTPVAPVAGFTCNSSTAGSVFLDSASNTFFGCNGTSLVTFGNALGTTSYNPGPSCKAINAATPAGAPSGLYWISPTGVAANAFQVYCDMTTDSGGWTLVMRTWYTNGSGGPCPGASACSWFRNATGAVNTPALLGANTEQNGKFSDAVINQIVGSGEYRWLSEVGSRVPVHSFFAPATFAAPSGTAAQMFTTAWFSYPRQGTGHTWTNSSDSSWGGWDGPDYGNGNFCISAAACGFDWNTGVSVAETDSTFYLHADSSGACGYAYPPSPCTGFGISVWVR